MDIYRHCEKCGALLFRKGSVVYCPNCGIVDEKTESEIPPEKLNYLN
jgi:uncharacterized Zn finger protein (UPF0148 family)